MKPFPYSSFSHSHLNLQQIVTANALVVHLVVGVVGVATALVFDKREAVPAFSDVRAS
jgi:hypothetical protein